MICSNRRDGTRIYLDGVRLAGLRASAGLTQREVAEAIGCTAAAVSSWETEAAIPSLPQIFRIAAFYGDALSASGAIEVKT